MSRPVGEANAGVPPPSAVAPTLRDVFRRESDALSHQFARYFVVGGMAFVVDFACLFALTQFAGMHYLVAGAIAFGVGLMTAYVLSRLWVFNRRSIENMMIEFAIFAAIGVVGLGLTEAILWFLYEKVHVHYLAAKFVAAGVVLFWNFGARKVILFR